MKSELSIQLPARPPLSSSDSLGRVLTCVYCGHEYPQDTPSWGNQVLTDHIKVCEKHPMRKLEADNAKLRKALVCLVGVDGKEELDMIEMHILDMEGHPDDSKAAIMGIKALRETLAP